MLALGTGGVAIAALQIARMMGAATIVTSSSEAKLERVRALGAVHTVNYRTHPDWGRRVRDWTGGGGLTTSWSSAVPARCRSRSRRCAWAAISPSSACSPAPPA